MLALVLVGLDPLAQLKKVHEDFVENFNVGIVTGMVGTLDPHQVPHGDVEAQLVAQGDFPAFHRKSLLGDSKVSPVDCHCAVIAHIVGAQPLLKIYL